MHSVYQQFRQLLPAAPLQAGSVVEVGAGVVTVALPGGATLKARGAADLGDHVFVRDGVLEGLAPSLPIELIEI